MPPPPRPQSEGKPNDPRPCHLSSFVALASLPARAIEIQQITSPGGIKAWLVEDHSIPFTALNLPSGAAPALTRPASAAPST
jgi:hypothetical protein